MDWSVGVGFLVLAVTALLLVGAAELGFFLGRRYRANSDPEARSQISMVEGSLLGLLALLLGFTFSMAVARFDRRQDYVVDEANALGTVLLRSQMLSESAEAAVKPKLRAYADARLELIEGASEREKLEVVLRKTSVLQAELWAIAKDETRSRPILSSSMFVTALNELYDLTEKRVSALENKVPFSVWIVLYIVASLAAGSLGFGSGLMGRRMLLPVLCLPILVATLLTLLVDLDNPRKGLIRVSQASMIRFRDSVK
ncbi:MAG TPA: hypothetical protein VM222_07230 [Planctomycetota bacterium]|nr:hypothetical protein [Planctomycetota bacterium]